MKGRIIWSYQKGTRPKTRLHNNIMERVTGIEPVSPAWEAEVIPLYDTRLVGRAGLEPATD